MESYHRLEEASEKRCQMPTISLGPNVSERNTNILREKILTPGTIPAFPHAGVKSSRNDHRTLRVNDFCLVLQQPRTVGRNSQQRAREAGPVPQGRGGRGQGKIIVIPSTTREPKLKTTENAWKPSAKEANKTAADDAQVNIPCLYYL